MSALRLGVAACLVALAFALALLSADVRAWPAALGGGDAVYAADPAGANWSPRTRLGGLAADLLRVRDDLSLRRALQLYSRAAGLRLRLDNALAVEDARARAQDALGAPARSSDPRAAAQARTLLGILAFRALARGTDTQVQAASAEFTAAIRAAPGAEDAKYDLELLLRATAAHGVRRQAGAGGGTGRTGRRGAGGGVPGSGY